MVFQLFLPTNLIFREHLLPPPPQPPLARAWLRRPIRRRCQCFVLWDVVSTVTPAPTACVLSATRNTCRDSREVDDPAPQEKKVGLQGAGSLHGCELGLFQSLQSLLIYILPVLSSSSRYLADSIGWRVCRKHSLRTQRRSGRNAPRGANDQVR